MCIKCNTEVGSFTRPVGLVLPNNYDDQSMLKKVPVDSGFLCNECFSKFYGTDEREFFLVPRSKFQGIVNLIVNSCVS